MSESGSIRNEELFDFDVHYHRFLIIAKKQ